MRPNPAREGLHERTSKPVFLTAQEEGIFVFDKDMMHVPAAQVSGEIDPVGAGDSCAAGIVSALCAERTSRKPRSSETPWRQSPSGRSAEPARHLRRKSWSGLWKYYLRAAPQALGRLGGQ